MELSKNELSKMEVDEAIGWSSTDSDTKTGKKLDPTRVKKREKKMMHKLNKMNLNIAKKFSNFKDELDSYVNEIKTSKLTKTQSLYQMKPKKF